MNLPNLTIAGMLPFHCQHCGASYTSTADVRDSNPLVAGTNPLEVVCALCWDDWLPLALHQRQVLRAELDERTAERDEGRQLLSNLRNERDQALRERDQALRELVSADVTLGRIRNLPPISMKVGPSDNFVEVVRWAALRAVLCHEEDA